MDEAIVIILEVIAGLLILTLTIGGVPLLMLFLKTQLRLERITASRAVIYSLLSVIILILLSSRLPNGSRVTLT